MDSRYVGGSIGQKYIRKFRSKGEKRLWDNIYDTLTEFGGFNQQGKATDRIFGLCGKRCIESKAEYKKRN